MMYGLLEAAFHARWLPLLVRVTCGWAVIAYAPPEYFAQGRPYRQAPPIAHPELLAVHIFDTTAKGGR